MSADSVDRAQTCIIRWVPEHPREPVGGSGVRVRHHLRRALETVVAFIAPGCELYLETTTSTEGVHYATFYPTHTHTHTPRHFCVTDNSLELLLDAVQ